MLPKDCTSEVIEVDNMYPKTAKTRKLYGMVYLKRQVLQFRRSTIYLDPLHLASYTWEENTVYKVRYFFVFAKKSYNFFYNPTLNQEQTRAQKETLIPSRTAAPPGAEKFSRNRTKNISLTNWNFYVFNCPH